MKKILILLLLISLSIAPLRIDISAESDYERLEEIAYKMAETTLVNAGSDLQIVSKTPLFDSTDEINGFLFHLANGDEKGYVIVYNSYGDLEVTEFSLTSDLDLDIDGKIYYNGLVSYCFKEQETLINVHTNETVEGYIAPEINLFDDSSSISPLAAVSFNVGTSSLDYGMTPILQNNVSPYGNKKCMQTSAAMVIQYWDENKIGFGNLTNKSGVELVNEITNYVPLKSDNSGTTLTSLVNGMRNYISSKGFNYSVTSHAGDLNNDTLPENYILTVKNDIVNERPGIVIVGQEAEYLSNNGTSLSGETMHAMAITGTMTSGNIDYLKVLDPWDGKTKFVAWDPYNWAERPYFAIYAVVRINITD